jgi:hypothetical protein
MGLALEQRHFAKEISRPNKPECFLLTAPAGLRNLHGPFSDEIKQVPGIALAENDFACVKCNEANIGRNLIQQIGFEAVEEAILR